MAHPRIKNGYTKIANELLEALCSYRLSGEEHLVLNVIIRKTYGFSKSEDQISISQFESLTKIDRTNIRRAIKNLTEKNILFTRFDDIDTRILKINKDFEMWKKVKKYTRRGGVKLPPPRGGQITPPQAEKKDDKGGGNFDSKGGVMLRIGGGKITPYKRNKQKKERNIAFAPQKTGISSGTKKKKKVKKKAEKVEVKKERPDAMIIFIIDEFRRWNLEAETWYKNKTQRGSIERLIKNYGVEFLVKTIKLLPKTNRLEFFPKISTAKELEIKWTRFEDACVIHKNKQKRKQDKNYVT